MNVRRTLKVDGKEYDYFSLKELEKTLDRDLSSFPYSLKVLLENLIRNNDGTTVTDDDVNTFASWTKNHVPEQEINFYPSRVVIQDFTKTKPKLLFFKDSLGLSENRKAVKPVHSVVLLLTLLPSRAFYLSNDTSNLRFILRTIK